MKKSIQEILPEINILSTTKMSIQWWTFQLFSKKPMDAKFVISQTKLIQVKKQFKTAKTTNFNGNGHRLKFNLNQY